MSDKRRQKSDDSDWSVEKSGRLLKPRGGSAESGLSPEEAAPDTETQLCGGGWGMIPMLAVQTSQLTGSAQRRSWLTG